MVMDEGDVNGDTLDRLGTFHGKKDGLNYPIIMIRVIGP